MNRTKTPFRPRSSVLALEPRLLFDGAGAVAAVDTFDHGSNAPEPESQAAAPAPEATTADPVMESGPTEAVTPAATLDAADAASPTAAAHTSDGTTGSAGEAQADVEPSRNQEQEPEQESEPADVLEPAAQTDDRDADADTARLDAEDLDGGTNPADSSNGASTLSDETQADAEAHPDEALESTSPGTLLIIDARVADHQTLLADLPSNTTVRLIGNNESGIDAVGEELASGGLFDTIHIISHGSAGSLTLGSDTIDSESISSHSSALQSWASYLTDDADILLYGCDIADGETGQILVSQLAHLTGADIAASSDDTGSADKGGDWVLEASTGNIEATALAVAAYSELLAATAITDSGAATPRVTTEDTPLAITGLVVAGGAADAITLTIVTTGGSANLGTTSGLAVTGNNSSSITVSGTIENVNLALESLAYSPTADQNSSTAGFTPSIALNVTSGGTGSVTVGNISVSAVNDAPDLGTQVNLVVSEGSPGVAFSLAQLASSANALDVDIATGQQVEGQQMVIINSLPGEGTLSYLGGAVAVGQVIPVSSLGSLRYIHNGTDVAAAQADSFNVTVSDGGGGQTSGAIGITIQPANRAPVISGSPSMIEGQVRVVAPTIDLGDSADTLATSAVEIIAVDNGGQGTLFFDADDDGVVDAGEAIVGSRTFTSAEAADLGTRLRFSQDGTEPNLPSGISPPTYTIRVTDSGGGEGVSGALSTTETIVIDVVPNNDDPTLSNAHASVGDALDVTEGVTTTITSAMLAIDDVDRDPSDPTQTTPSNQLVYTMETRPTQGEIQLFLGGTVGPDGNGWIVLGDGGRFTQAQIDASQVRFYQTTDVTVDTLDNFTFTVRDSAFGDDVVSDPTDPNPPGGREGGVRDTPTGPIATQTFHLNIDANDTAHVNPYTGDPRPATQGYGGSNMTYSFVAVVPDPGNSSVTWSEANVDAAAGGYVITNAMLSYAVTRTDNNGTPSNTSDDVSVTVPPSQTVYTLTAPPPNGTLQRLVDGTWEDMPVNSQFTQADIDSGNTIRFVHDGGEDHAATFGYTVSDGTPNSFDGTFAIQVTPINDRPTASAGTAAQVREGDGNQPGNTDSVVRLGTTQLGMGDADQSQDGLGGEGIADFLWFQVDAQPADGAATERGELQRWNGSAWVTLTPGEWLPSSLLSASADGATSGLRYVHDGSEPLAYLAGGPLVRFSYTVRDDLSDGSDPFATSSAPVAVDDGSPQSNESTAATVTINIIPVNDAPLIADRPADTDPSIGATITSGGALTGANQVLENVREGSTTVITSSHLTAVDRDNTTTQRQYRITQDTTQGTVLLNGAALGVGSTFTQADIDAGRVSYRHGGDEINASTTDSLGTYNDSFHFVVNDGVLADSGADANNNVFLITLAPANDAPTVTAPSGPINIDSTNPLYNPVSGFSVDDPDLTNPATSTDFLQVTVRLRDSGGMPVTDYATGFAGGGVQLGYDTGSGVVLTENGANNILQFQGTRAEVNAALAGLTATFANDADNTYQLEVIVDDRIRNAAGILVPAAGNDANGGEVNQGAAPGGATTAVDGTAYDWSTTTTVPANSGNIASSTVVLRASHTNDAPVFTGPTSVTVVEDVRSPIGNGTTDRFVVSDAESTAFGTPVTVTVSVPSGQGALFVGPSSAATHTPSGGQAVSVGGSGTSTLTLTGRADDIEAVLNGRNFADTAADANTGLRYTGASNANHDQNTGNAGDVTLTLAFNEGASSIGGDSGSGSVANTVTNLTPALTITAINDAPTVAVGTGAIAIAGTGVTPVPGFVVNDVDADDGDADGETDTDGVIQVTVRVLDASGAPLVQASYSTLGISLDSTTTSGGATVDTSLNGSTQALELRGTRDQINAYLVGLQVTFANDVGANVDATYSIEVVADDRLRDASGALTSGANGGANNQQAALPAVPTTDTFNAYATSVAAYSVYNVTRGTRGVFISTINDPGHITATNVTVNEGSATLSLNGTNGQFNLADADDNGASTMEVTVTVGAGTITAVGGAGGTVTGVGGTTITITGATEAQINTRLNAITVTFPDVAGAATSADWNGSFDVTVVYNDRGNTGVRPGSLLGDTDNPRAGNGDFSYADSSTNNLVTTRTITVTVNPVNDAPTLTGSGAATLPAGTEDTSGGAGNSVSNLFSGAFTDDKDAVGDGTAGSIANTFAGIAITTNNAVAGQGVWQYSTDSGATWTALPTVSTGTALLLAPDATLRFNPADDFHGTPGALGARLVDSSGGVVTTGGTANVAASTRFSDASNAVTLGTTVTNVNDRPAGSNAMLAAINEDVTNPPGNTVQNLFNPGYSDGTDDRTGITGGGNATTAFGGVAIVGDTANALTEGQWQYSTDGGSSWISVGTPSDGSALVLPTTAGLRFLPVADYNGTPPALTVRVADTPQTFSAAADLGLDAVESNNATRTWSEVVTLGTSVTSVDEPVTVTVPDDRIQTLPDGVITDHVVFESGLPGGSSPDADDLMVDSDFTIAVPDGFPATGTAVSLGYIDASGGAGLLNLTAVDIEALTTNNQTITTRYGDLVINGYTKNPDRTVTLDYTYTLTNPPEVSGASVTEAFAITAYDSDGDSDGTMALNIKIVDDVPTANADTNSVDKEDVTVTGNVVTGVGSVGTLGVDSSGADGLAALPVTGVAAGTIAGPVSTGVGSSVAGTYGSITLQADGSYSYMVNSANADVVALGNGATLTEVFSYTINDADGDPSTTTLTITIDGNLRPVPANDSFTTNEDTALSDTLATNDTLGDGTAAEHTWDKLTDPAHGTVVVNANGTFVYTPTGNYNGSDSFTYTLTDSDGNSSTATANLTVSPVNDPPVLTGAGSTVSYTENGTAVTLEPGTTNAWGFTDIDDTQLVQATAQITAGLNADDVLAVSAAALPTGWTQSYDATTGLLTLDGAGAPANAANVFSALSTVSYANTGDDPGNATRTVTWRVTDANSDNASNGQLVSNTLTTTLNVLPVNDPPVATDNTNTVTEDAVPGTATGNVRTDGALDSDPDNAMADVPVTAIVATTAGGSAVPVSGATTVVGEYGTLVINPDGSYTYSLDNSNPTVNGLGAGATLDEVFTYSITDPGNLSDDALLTITINGNTDGPPAVVPVDGNTPGAADGVATVYESGLTADGPTGQSETATGTIALTAPDNIASISLGGTVVTLAQLQALSSTTTVVIDTGEGTLTLTGFAQNGTGPVTSGDLTYTYTLNDDIVHSGPDAASSLDTIALVITDDSMATGTGDLVIQIVDDVPTANPDTDRVDKEVGTVTGNVVTDASTGDRIGADGPATPGPVTGVVAGSPAGPVNTGVGSGVTGAYGTITLLPDGSYTYVVDPANADVLALGFGSSLSDVFTYTITDADGDTSTTTLTIGIDGNLRPVAADDTFTTDEDTPLSGSLLGNDTLGDGSTADHTWDKLTDPAHGTVVVNANGTFVYTPNPNFNGTDSFTYTVTDSDGNTSTATVNLTVTSVNDVPVAVDDRTSTRYNTPVSGNLTGNDTPSGDGGNVWSVATPPSHGSVVVNPDGTYRYTPDAGFSGTDRFTYTITDANGDTSTATMTITVAAGPVVPAPQPPQAPEAPLQPVPRPDVPPARSAVPEVMLQPLNPLQGDQAREESVYFDGGVFNGVVRLPVPMHPVVYVTPGVNAAQTERGATDTRYYSDPAVAHRGEVESGSIGAGLGMDPVLYVQHAVRASQARSVWLDEVVNGRLGRISLGSDGMIRTPEWFEPLPENIVPEMPGAKGDGPDGSVAPGDAKNDAAKEASPASPRPAPVDRLAGQGKAPGSPQRPAAAPSFSDQLRSSAGRAPTVN